MFTSTRGPTITGARIGRTGRIDSDRAAVRTDSVVVMYPFGDVATHVEQTQ